jgi:glycosyltransferase involved in cell wall biosynthesis
MMKAKGDAVLLIAADLQEPPELLEQFLPALLEGYDAAIGYKEASRENPVMWWLRGRYYWLMKCLGMTTIPERYSGFGLYSRRLVEAFRADWISEPSMRVLLPRNATSIQSFPYVHQQRHQGKSSYSFYGYSREAIKNIVRNSRNLPHLTGKLAGLMACIAIGSVPLMVMAKIVAWQSFAPGIATVLIIVLLFVSLILAFIAVILDRLDQILLRLDPPCRAVKQSAVYD